MTAFTMLKRIPMAIIANGILPRPFSRKGKMKARWK